MRRLFFLVALAPLAACLESQVDPGSCASSEDDCLEGCAHTCNLAPETPAFERQRELAGQDVFLWSFGCAACVHDCRVEAELCGR